MTTKMSPRKAKKINDVYRLRRDNLNVKNFWILVGEDSISLAEQKSGERPKQTITVPRGVFDRLVDWYMREQVLRDHQ